MNVLTKVRLLIATSLAIPLLILGSAQEIFAGYADEIMADDPFAYYRLDDEPGAIEAEYLGSSFDIVAEYHQDTELGVPGLISSDPGNTAARFVFALDGDDTSGVHVMDSDDLNVNLGPWVDKTILLWFQADDVSPVEEQVLWEQGGSTRGINLYIADGEAYVGAWNRASDGPGAPWESGDDDPEGGNVYLRTPVESGQIYMLGLVMAGDDVDVQGTLTGYLNGQPFDEKTGVGQIYNHGDDAGIGHVHQNTYFQSGNWNNGNGRHFEGVIDEVALFNTALSADRILELYMAGGGAGQAPLQAGDANMDYEFNQLDLVQVQIAAKYLTGQPATWGEGDWDGAPGGEPGNPPAGDGMFNQLDIIAALGAGTYLTGPYAAIVPGGNPGDEQTSIIYNPTTGELGVDAPASTELTSINIDSAGAIFTGAAAENLGGSFDNDADNNIFKATFGSSFGSLSFGSVAQPGLSADFVANDLTVVGSLAGGGDLGAVDLIYVPEPSTLVLLGLGLLAWLGTARRRR